MQDKMYMEVNVRYMRKQGVTPPELPPLPGDVLAAWGVRMPNDDASGDAEAGGAGLSDARATVKVGRQEADVTRDGKRGAVVHLSVSIANAKNRLCEVISGFIDEEENVVRAGAGHRADPDGFLLVGTTVRPNSDDAQFADVQLFVPYDALPAGSGKRYLGFVMVDCAGRPLSKPDRDALFVVATGNRAAAPGGDIADALVRVKTLKGTVTLLAGQDPKQTLLAISLRSTKVSDDDLALIATIAQMGSLDLQGTAITDAGVAHLRGLPELRKLSLAHTKVTRLCALHLLECPRLVELDVSGSDFPPDFKWNSPAFGPTEPDLSAAKPAFEEGTFAGSWDTTYGWMTLTQDGQKASGFYLMKAGSDRARCTLEGRVERNKLTFRRQDVRQSLGHDPRRDAFDL
jgi:hypothetical protein